MRISLLIIGLAFMSGLMLPGRCDPPPLKESLPAVKVALSAVISQQLAAFHAGNFTKAYGFAAVEFRSKYNQAVFEQMVKLGYPILTRFTSTAFGPVLDDGENGMVYVRVTDAAGEQMYLYSLRREKSGWGIMGVTRREEDGPEPTAVPAPEAPQKLPPLSA